MASSDSRNQRAAQMKMDTECTHIGETHYPAYSFQDIVKLIRLWFLYSLKFLAGGKQYLCITPPFYTHQILYDRYNRTFVFIKIRNSVDWIQLSYIYLNADYDLSKLHFINVNAFYKKIISRSKSPLILDCGANIGLATKYFSERYPRANIVAIEPDPENAALARRNNKAGPVRIVQAGIASELGKGRIIDMGASNAFRVELDLAGDLELISINSILKGVEADNVQPFVIKIDIEGFERELFSNNTEWIDFFPIIIVELHDWMMPGQNISNNFLKCVAARGRDFIHLDRYIVSISNELM